MDKKQIYTTYLEKVKLIKNARRDIEMGMNDISNLVVQLVLDNSDMAIDEAYANVIIDDDEGEPAFRSSATHMAMKHMTINKFHGRDHATYKIGDLVCTRRTEQHRRKLSGG